MGVGVLSDLVNFSGNTCCFHLVSKFHMGLAEEDQSLALKRKVNFDTQLSDSSAAEIRIEEVIPVADSLGRKAFLIGIFTCITNLISH